MCPLQSHQQELGDSLIRGLFLEHFFIAEAQQAPSNTSMFLPSNVSKLGTDKQKSWFAQNFEIL